MAKGEGRKTFLKQANDLWYASPKPIPRETMREINRLLELHDQFVVGQGTTAAGPTTLASSGANELEAKRVAAGVMTTREKDLILAAQDLEADGAPVRVGAAQGREQTEGAVAERLGSRGGAERRLAAPALSYAGGRRARTSARLPRYRWNASSMCRISPRAPAGR